MSDWSWTFGKNQKRKEKTVEREPEDGNQRTIINMR